MNERPKVTCNETRTIRSDFVFSRDLNDKDTYYGGNIMAHFDSAGGGASFKFLKNASFTATVDVMTFVSPVHKTEEIYVESYVSGAGKSSVEAFTKMIATDLKTNQSRVVAYAFLTYVLENRNNKDFVMPELVPESEEEIAICQDYQKRRQLNLEKRKDNKAIEAAISTKPIWKKH